MVAEALSEQAAPQVASVGGAGSLRQSGLMGHLEIEDNRNEHSEESLAYPSGLQLWSTMALLCIACFLSGLDLTIVAVTVPSLTDQFQTIADIGWYSAAYFAQMYNLFRAKTVFLVGLVIFETGSLVCTLAPTSAIFILGRAISGLGRGAINGGLFKSSVIAFLYLDKA
ncbi:hypothetical protein QQZ08_005011 [Neonectria magnoliae]|uniref:Major facilitator superfamily (MFS) profile domain-containing protein n=1 Tax=Neonectria magnoliae TaxID=2732573 RepID=A0ABR1I623_9HYPO